MKKALILVTLLLSACSLCPEKKQEVIYRDVPVLVVPTVDPNIYDRPKLMIDELRQEDKKDPGLVGVYYDATIEQLLGHIDVLEAILKKYTQVSKETKINESTNP